MTDKHAIPISSHIPSAFIGTGESLLGSYGNQKAADYQLPLEYLTRHMILFGSTGSGKSVCIKSVCESAVINRIPTVVFDIVGDLTGLAIPLKSQQIAEHYGLGERYRTMPVTGKSLDIANLMSKRVQPFVYSMDSQYCRELSLSPLTAVPSGFSYERRRELISPNSELNWITYAQEQADLFVQLLGCFGSMKNFEPYRGLLAEVILEAWDQDIDLSGSTGVTNLIALLRNNTRTSEDRMPKSVLEGALRQMKALNDGANQLAMEGSRLDIGRIIAEAGSKTPLVIIRMSKSNKVFNPVLFSSVMRDILTWSHTQPCQPKIPNVVVAVDELRCSNLPQENLLAPANYTKHPSAGILRSALRIGRHTGVSMVLGTQGIADVDDNMLTNINTIVSGQINGKLATTLYQGFCDPRYHKAVETQFKKLNAGTLMVHSSNDKGQIYKVTVRRLATAHVNVDAELLKQLIDDGVLVGENTRRSSAMYADYCQSVIRSLLYQTPHAPDYCHDILHEAIERLARAAPSSEKRLAM